MPKRTTVSVSSNPSHKLTAASGLIRISQLAVSFSDFLVQVSHISQRSFAYTLMPDSVTSLRHEVCV
jgi:hypothetical protein